MYVKNLKPFSKYVNVLNKDKIGSSSCHLVILKFSFKNLKISKDRLLSFFLKKGIFLQQHYKPIYLFELYKKKMESKFFKNSNAYFMNCISFPVHFELTNSQLKKCFQILKKLIIQR